jgi:hypothetical protein
LAHFFWVLLLLLLLLLTIVGSGVDTGWVVCEDCSGFCTGVPHVCPQWTQNLAVVSILTEHCAHFLW